MNIQDYTALSYPEWYRVERETENTIKRLGTIEELEYYLKNNDAYIRRLAIIRVGQLRLISSMVTLNTMLDSSSEINENKCLLAWIIKSMLSDNKQKNFIFNDLIQKYTGNETYESLFGIIVNDEPHPADFNFISGVQDKLNEINKRINKSRQVIDFEMPFSLKEWSNECFKSISVNSRRALFNLPILIYKAFRYIVRKLPLIGITLLNALKITGTSVGRAISSIYKLLTTNTKANTKKNNSPNQWTLSKIADSLRTLFLHNKRYVSSSRNKAYYRKSLRYSIKDAMLIPLRIIFAPFRFLYAYKLYFAIALIVIYTLSTYTLYGRAISKKYLDIDLKIIQESVINKASTTISMYWLEFKAKIDFDGIKATAKEIESSDTVISKDSDIQIIKQENHLKAAKYFRVSSQKGLNLRTSPKLDAELVTELPIAYNSLVEYLFNSTEDTNGILWYNIKTDDGFLGWASAKFLVEANN